MADNSSTFLPADDFPDDLDPSATLDVLDERLVNPGAQPPDLTIDDSPPPPLGRSWAFDFTTNTLVSASSGIAQTTGLGTLRTWCEKALRTDLGAYPIHSDDYGMLRPFDIIGMQLSDISEDDLQDRVTDALTVHPLIDSITDFDMTYDPMDDFLSVTFTVVLIDQQLLVVTDLQLP